MSWETTEISGTTYEYRSENEGRPFGEKDEYELPDAVDYFHGDGRAAFRVSAHTAFITEGQEIHLHALPGRDDQCPEDPHSCLGQWDVEGFGTVLDGLRVIQTGLDVDASPGKIIETMEDRMGGVDLESNVEDHGTDDTHVHRIE